MLKTSDIIKLLAAQKEILSMAEEVTNQMLIAPDEELPDLVADRGELLGKAVKIEEEIRMAVCDDEHRLNVIKCSCSVSELDGEMKALFEAALRVKAVINRIGRLEADVLERMESERDTARKRIEALNKSSHSIAANYKYAVQTGFSQNFFQGKTRMI